MTDTITHEFVSPLGASADPDRVDGPKFNAGHIIRFGLLSDIKSTGPVGIPGTSGLVADAATVYPNPALPFFVGNRWYGPRGSYASTRLVSGRLYARPFLVGGLTTFDRLGCYISDIGSPGALINLAIYANDGGKPGALLISSGFLAADAFGAVTVAFDETFDGLVWLACVARSDDATLGYLDDDAAVTGGTYTITILGQTTAAIAWNASAATVKAAIEALSSIGAHVVSVTGTNFNTGYTVVFDSTITVVTADVTFNTGSLVGISSLDYTVAQTRPSILLDTTSHDPLIGFADPIVAGDIASGYSQDSVTTLPDPWGSTYDPAAGPLIYLRAKL